MQRRTSLGKSDVSWLALNRSRRKKKVRRRQTTTRTSKQTRCTATTHHSFRGSFSAGSTPIFASKYAFCSIKFFQNLQENHLLASKFCKFLQEPKCFCKIFKNISLQSVAHVGPPFRKRRSLISENPWGENVHARKLTCQLRPMNATASRASARSQAQSRRR